MNSLNCTTLASSSTSSMTLSSLATISTGKEAKQAKGSASENSRLIIGMLLIYGLKVFWSTSGALSSDAEVEETVFWPDDEGLVSFSCFCDSWAAAAAGMSLAFSLLEPRNSLGWDFNAISRSSRALWRWSESASSEHWRRLLTLFASSVNTFETSVARRMHGSLKRDRTDFGVYSEIKIKIIYNNSNSNYN